LTHIHLDHAGACGHLVDIFPNATVHVHEDGASYMVDPERLVSSTRRTFGDAHDRLWGEMKGVPADRITAWSPGDAGPWAGIRTISTPGHIAHHVAYLDERDGTLFAGDSMGIVLAGGPTHPATPPPAVDLRAWEGTLEEIGMIGPERFGATHFGMHEGVDVRREQMRSRLAALEARVRVALAEDDTSDAERFNDEVMEELAPYMGEDRVRRYFDMFSAATDWAGVAFYLKRNP
jgi:glyoxylase-like metal-dependent hydrolase (beta-lactamase superfamily II)